MPLLYEQLAQTIGKQIDQGIYRAGDRLPGVRPLSKQYAMSISTVVRALELLEDQGVVSARPRSGIYVRGGAREAPEPQMSLPELDPVAVSSQAIALRLAQSTQEANMASLGAAVPAASFLPTQALNRSVASVLRSYGDRIHQYAFPPGELALRRQIAKRMAAIQCPVTPEEIVVTNGCQEAMRLSLSAVTNAGDIVVIESPAFYGLLQVVSSLGLKALEIPTHPDRGMSLTALNLALEQWLVKACVIVPHYSNPLGYCMPDERKRALVELLDEFKVPLVENDVNGDLGFDQIRPSPVKVHEKNTPVFYCSSFSKTLSPGLRVGWVTATNQVQALMHQKYVMNLATPTLPQLAIADFLEKGRYERYVKQVRALYERHVGQMSRAVERYFPENTKMTRPRGGFVLWVELPPHVDALSVYQDAIQEGVSISPGPVFSATMKYRNFIRLNCAQLWDESLEQAVKRLGEIVYQRGTKNP